ncbi:glycoside hydrolase family 78 protein [Salipiger pacificus]|nr:glycoside hydrolase family 78 protein [Alloyangia pacifica]MCA0947280.1 glycoside hydrolase family 78 protein [Alloyangia pacifica]
MAGVSPPAALRPVALRCALQAEPRGLNDLCPRLSWGCEGAAELAASRVVLGRGREAVASGQGDLWDSGWLCGTPSPLRYAGAPLPRDARLWWAVGLRDAQGAETWSDPAPIFTGLNPSDWDAQWIARYFVLPAGREVPQDSAYDNRFQARPADYLRRTFDLPEAPVRAFVYVTALGLYELHLNGQRVGEDVMAPGWTDYHTRTEYTVHDVTAELRAGRNALGAILGEGWYSGRIGHNQRRAGNHYGGRPAFLCQLHLEYADGRTQRITTDARWRTRQGPVCYSDFLAGEMYDARLEMPGWDTPEFEEINWQPVEVFIPDPRAPQLDAARAPLSREVATLAPRAETTAPDGERIFDFGQNLAGYVTLEVEAPAGTEIRLRHAERLDEQGALYTANLRFAVSEDIYICKGGGPERFTPRFTFHGFQYVGLGASGPVARLDLNAVAIQSDLPLTGQIETGHPMVNQLVSNIFWSQRGNFLSVPTDCPQRDERYGWSADAQVFWRTAGYFMDVSAFTEKWLQDMVDGQSAEGVFPDVAPTKPLNPYRLTPQPGAPAWGDAPVILCRDHWLRYGDAGLLRDMWGPLVAWMDYIERENPDGIRVRAVHNNYGDWLTIGPVTDRALVATAYWIHLADIMARLAGVLGEPETRWTELAMRLRTAFLDRFWRDGRLSGDTQTAYLLALDFALLPEALRPQAAERLGALLDAADGHLQTGFLGVRHLAPVVCDWLGPERAIDLLLKETYPSWGFSIRQGATTIWERWDGWTPEKGFQSTAMNSFNHYAYGAVGEWIWARLAGIDWSAAGPGYRLLAMRPVFDRRIGHLKARYEAATGPVQSAWAYEREAVVWEVSLPPGTGADVILSDGWSLDGKGEFTLGAGAHRLTLQRTA